MSGKRDIIALERRVKEIYNSDKSNPELYSAIKDLAAAILVVKSMAYDSHEVDEISHMLATDFYMKINHEGLRVEKWTKYVRLRLYRMRSNYLKDYKHIEIQIDDPVENDRFADRWVRSANYSIQTKEFELDDLVESLPILFFQIYEEYCRYRKNSEEYRLVKLSIIFSIERRIMNHDPNVVVLVGLDESYEEYVKFMITLMYKRLGVKLHKLLGEDLSRSSELNELIGAPWNVDNDD